MSHPTTRLPQRLGDFGDVDWGLCDSRRSEDLHCRCLGIAVVNVQLFGWRERPARPSQKELECGVEPSTRRELLLDRSKDSPQRRLQPPARQQLVDVDVEDEG